MTVAITTDNLRLDTECKVQAMLADLGSGYRRGKALATVEAVQVAWNELLPRLRAASAKVLYPSKNGGLLVEDGLYGSQTGTAAQNFFTGPKLPDRASDLPVWYSRNVGIITAMCVPQPPVSPVPPAPALPLSPVVPIALAKEPPPQVVTPPPSPVTPYVAPPPPEPPIMGSDTITYTPKEALPPVPMPPVVKLTPEPPPLVQIQHPAPPALIPEPIAPAPLTVTPLPGRLLMASDSSKRRGDYPLLAIVLGVGGVATVLGFWLLKGKK